MIVFQLNICLPDRIAEFVQGAGKSTQTGPEGRKMFLLKLATTIIQPIFANLGPKSGKLREITLNPTFTVCNAAYLKRHVSPPVWGISGLRIEGSQHFSALVQVKQIVGGK
ncbi:MAG: hypothetical protein ACPHF4_12380, partial [Rubripirellula sp.]